MRRLARILLVAVMLPLAVPPLPAAAAAVPPAGAGVTVTLVTGDRVTVDATGGQPTARIEPADRPGRRVSFATWYAGGDLRVLPSDVARLVPGTLDPRLFDVSALIRAGYDDRSATSIPLIVRRPAGLSATADSPLRTVRALPSIGAAAVRLPKASAARWGAQLASIGGAPGALAAPSAVWLDAPVHARSSSPAVVTGYQSAPADPIGRLDDNLRQIGAPDAWAAGLSGAGVRVAVLDTGVDATHPDLAGRVVAAANFTDSPDVTDHNGHGTHVASIVGGSGAAAGGERRGVAFDAALLSGKVLGDDGVGPSSAIIAGMEWAIGEGARIVNLSLGSDAPTDGQDPLSLAVNALSAAHGVLFVASAGNSGPGAGTVGAPGAADAALTVGAVDRRDRLADFSSRGPRLGDSAIKPDLAAPGVDIIAARATGTSLGDPVSARYTRLSGTSMAAPHAAGAAALLAQLHPQWTAERLKAALVGTTAAAGFGVFDGGSGRLDLPTAVPQQLLAAPAAAGFGFVSYPQAGLPPRTQQLTLTNTGGAPVTVELTASLRTPRGHPAPAGMLSVSPARITVPAGGTATATVELAVALGGFGAFGGTVVATTAGLPALRVPVGVVKESTRYLVHLRALDRAGNAPVDTLATLVNLTDVTASPPAPVLLSGGEATVRLVPGSYVVTAAIPTVEPGGGGGDDSSVADVVTSVAISTLADVAVDRDREVVLDAAAAVPLTARVSGVDTVPADVRVFVAVRDPAGNGFVLGYDTSAQDVVEGKLLVQPTEPVRQGALELSSKWRLDTVGGGPTYDLVFAGPRFPAVLDYVADPRDLARIKDTYRAPLVPIEYREARFVFTDLNPVSVAVPQPVPGTAPVERSEYLTGGSAYSWFQCATVVVPDAGGVGDYCQAPAAYRARSTVEHGWLRAPLRTTVGVFRSATTLQIGMNDLADDAGHAGSISGFVFAHRSFVLYRNGVLLAEGTDPLGVRRVPDGPAVFRLTRTLELPPDLLPVSTRVESSWTFAATPPAAGKPAVAVPVVDAAVHVPVDAGNRVPAGVPLAVEVDASQGATVSLALSTDDGLSWTSVALHRHGDDAYQATVPAELLVAGGLVSIRMIATDPAGNRTEQLILRAFGVQQLA